MSLALNFLTMTNDEKYIWLHEPSFTYKYISLYKNEMKKNIFPLLSAPSLLFYYLKVLVQSIQLTVFYSLMGHIRI